MSESICDRCLYAKWSRNSKGVVITSIPGWCNFDMEKLKVQFPSAIVHEWPGLQKRSIFYDGEHGDCPQYEPVELALLPEGMKDV